MDRISALRNVEDALADFEEGEADLETVERRVQAVLRTYASEFDRGSLAAYRVAGDGESVVVVAPSPGEARERASDLGDLAPREVERLSTRDE